MPKTIALNYLLFLLTKYTFFFFIKKPPVVSYFTSTVPTPLAWPRLVAKATPSDVIRIALLRIVPTSINHPTGWQRHAYVQSC